ncbi:MAG: magnesium chelatase subunit D family protein [Desulfobacteraceae bacterium]|nr:magnesium chelatase subunit D family protein [Desulfobacteraceae bacterium]MBC2757454.1 magnesium chelatase subunit D family protein [Desulfobacteraceae bacterium]
MKEFTPPIFPFTAIVNQKALKLALIIGIIHPGVMGVLIRGQKGTAKSTAVRALSNLLPKIKVVSNCIYGCDPDAPLQILCRDCRKIILEGATFDTDFIKVPFVTLPVNATEDNLAGSIDLEHAIKSGQTNFLAGLLAKAHRGILYVDEINLLDDHLVDLILDAAGGGINIVEREGVSISHPSRFLLAGTMNPEEGELSPQFLDRFGLCIGVDEVEDLSQRVEIIKRREAFEKDPLLFHEKWQAEEKKEAIRIKNAVHLVDSVQTNGYQHKNIAMICKDAGVAGHRADIVIDNASKAIAAYMERHEVDDRDIRLAASMALPHRFRKILENGMPRQEGKCRMPKIGNKSAGIMQDTEESQEESHPLDKKTDLHKTDDRKAQLNLYRQNTPSDDHDNNADKKNEVSRASGMAENRIYEIGKPVTIATRDICHDRRIISRNSGGRRNRSKTMLKKGRYVRSTMNRISNDIALDATLRAAAPYQTLRQKGPMSINIEPQDLRHKIRERKICTLLIFIVDASGSMGARLMTEAKGAIMFLLMEAYQKRDRVCMIAFKDDRSELLLPPTDSIELAKKKLEDLPSGGKTPIAAGLLQGCLVADKCFHSSKNLLPLLILITDGRANIGTDSLGLKTGTNVFHIFREIFILADHIHQKPYLKSLVLDTEEKSSIRLGRAKEIAEYMGAKYMILNEIQSQNIYGAVCTQLGR